MCHRVSTIKLEKTSIVYSQEQSKEVVQSGNNLGLAAIVDMCNN